MYCISLPLDPPLISSIAPTNIVSPRTTTVSITCVYDGNPDPVVSWFRGSVLLDDASDDVTITTTSTESTLTLSNIQPDDGGNYRCITNNTIGPGDVVGGYASDNVSLVVQGMEREREEEKEGGRDRKVNVNGQWWNFATVTLRVVQKYNICFCLILICSY